MRKIKDFSGGSAFRRFGVSGSKQNHGLSPHDFVWTVDRMGFLEGEND